MLPITTTGACAAAFEKGAFASLVPVYLYAMSRVERGVIYARDRLGAQLDHFALRVMPWWLVLF